MATKKHNNGKSKQSTHGSNSIRIRLSKSQMEFIGLKEVVVNTRNLTIRRASIDDINRQNMHSDLHLKTDDESLCGDYLLERENEDLFYLTRVD